MKITNTSKNYFYFSLDQCDYDQYGYFQVRAFLNALKKEFNNHERFWLQKMKCWSINKSSKEKFDRLVNHYFTQNQESIV